MTPEQQAELIASLKEYQAANQQFEKQNTQLRDTLHTKGVMERKVFNALKVVKAEIMDDKGNIDTAKAMGLMMDQTKQQKLAASLSELNEVINYYEENVVTIIK